MQIALVIALVMSTAIAQTPAQFETAMENHAGLTFSPDGSTAFWTAWNGRWGRKAASQRVIYVSQRQNGAWSEPLPAPFSGDFSDDDPFVSTDGSWLYFVSERPASVSDDKLDRNIWRYSLIEQNRLEFLSINSDAAEHSPVVTASGALFFASARDGGFGEGDLYRAAPRGGDFHSPERLGAAINSPTGEWNLWVSPDESEIIYEASSRPTNVSIPGDLYYSWRSASGWTSAMPVPGLNSRDSDLLPRMHPDGDTLYYTTAPIGGHARIAAVEWRPLRSELRATYAPTLLVANRSSHEVTFVDLARGEVVARVPTGEGPHLLSNVSGGRVLATGYGEFPRPHSEPVSSRPPFLQALNSRLSLIDVVDRAVLLETTLANCDKPHASLIVEQRGYVTCEGEKRVLIVDLRNGAKLGHFDTLQQGSHVLSFEPDSRTLAASNTDSGSITLINIDSGETRIVELAPGSEGALATAGRIWVGNAFDDSVSVVDPRTSREIERIDAICRFPISLDQDSRDQIWTACFASAELVSIDPETNTIQRRISLDEQPLNLLLHPIRNLAYVSFPRQNAIGEISLDSGNELRRIPVGIEPDGLRWTESVD